MQRYKIPDDYCGPVLFSHPCGEWVRFEDVPRWIPVSEEYPDFECLCLGKNKEVIIGYISLIDDEFIAENEHEVLQNVTHWQEIQPPKDEK